MERLARMERLALDKFRKGISEQRQEFHRGDGNGDEGTRTANYMLGDSCSDMGRAKRQEGWRRGTTARDQHQQ
jgi:hypothetical protein